MILRGILEILKVLELKDKNRFLRGEMILSMMKMINTEFMLGELKNVCQKDQNCLSCFQLFLRDHDKRFS